MNGDTFLVAMIFFLIGCAAGLLLFLYIKKVTREPSKDGVTFVEIKRHRQIGALGSYTLTKEELLEELGNPRFNYLFDSAVSPCGRYIKVSIRVVNNRNDGKY